MPKQKSLFSKLISCSYCNGNFKFIMDRKIKKWICSDYSRFGKNYCQRNAIEEEYLIQIISAYCHKNRISFELTYEFMSRVVEKIHVSKEEIRVKYKNNNEEESIITGNLYKI